jgi:hypothetical protein
VEAVEAVAEPESPAETYDEAPAAAEQETPFVPVMTPEADGETAEPNWESDEAVAAEQSDEAVPAALQEEAVSAEGTEGTEGSEEPEGAKEEEPVGAVVMPRSTGAGSWLRWPNNSGSDPGN